MSQDLDSLYDESDEQLRTGTLSFSKEPQETSRTCQHIQSWRNAPAALNMRSDGAATNGVDDILTDTGLKLQIVSAQIEKELETDKRYVAYTINFWKDGVEPDPNPAFIERRYTDFLDLYNALRREQPALMNRVSFPRKVMVGNFGPDVIFERRTGFENFLQFLSREDKLHQSPSFAAFLQGAEQREAKAWIEKKAYECAIPLLENSFRLLNKIYTDRHPFVIVALCRLVACCAAETADSADGAGASNGGRAERYAEIALRRFGGISDSELLRFYVPLLQLCVHLWWLLGKDKQALSDRLENLKRRGIKVDGCDSLLDAVMAVS